jgi:molecular chaperone GrpE
MVDDQDKNAEETLKDPASVARAYEEHAEEHSAEAAVAPSAASAELKTSIEKIAALETDLMSAKKEAAESADKAMRARAEFDNYRKRADREKAEQVRYGNERLIRELLSVMDNFERALKHAENGQVNGETLESLKSGIKLVYDQMCGTLTRYGVKPVETVGQQFDPNKHEAIVHAESEELAPGTVVEELQKGYYLEERLLRPAMVSVARRPENG